jgi:adenylate cyclase
MDQARLRRERKITRLGALGGMLLVMLVGQLLLLNFGNGLARLSYDLTFALKPLKAKPVPEELVMVFVDPKVKAGLGQPPDEPLSRRFYTQLLDRLTREGARLVVFDILFDTADLNADSEFVEAIRRNGRVVLVGANIQQWRGDFPMYVALPPIAPLQDAAAGWGLANVPIDPDLGVRALGPGTEELPSVSWVAATLLEAKVTRDETRWRERWINYYCEPKVLRAVDLDQALMPDGLRADFFRDKIVVVGSRGGEGGIAGAARDEFRTPYALRSEPLAPGATVHAFALLNLLRGDWLSRLTFAQESFLVLFWGILISVGLLQLRPWSAIIAALVAFCGFTLVVVWLQTQHQIWFSWLAPAALQTLVAMLWAVGFRYVFEMRRRRRIQHALAVYLSPHMAERVANSDFDLSLGGKEMHATIMFTDLEGFTAMTEKMPPAEVSRILISYFTETTRAILEKDGMIIKYMGDAVMAAWGTLPPNPRSAPTAVAAALEMRRAGGKEIAGRHFRTRIGINSGLVLAGNLGSEFRFDYSAIGETTNVASRLESMNKHLGTDILITEATRRELDRDIVVRALGQFVVAGTTRPLNIYEVVGRKDEFDPPPAWLGLFAQALEHFKRRELDAAEAAFLKVSELRGMPDGPSGFYLKETARQRTKPTDEAVWDGVIRFESK